VIPRDYITEWRNKAPWVDDAQVEQDLVISKALVDIFTLCLPFIHPGGIFKRSGEHIHDAGRQLV